MTTCDDLQGSLAAAVYDELAAAERQRLAAHLAICQDCAATLVELRQTVAALPPAAATHGASLEDLWPRLEPRLDEADRLAARERTAHRRRWLVAAAVAFTVGMALWLAIGRRPPVAVAPSPGVLARVTDSATDRTTDSELERYLERATPLVLAVANRDLARPLLGQAHLAGERRLAGELAAQAATIHERLASRRPRQALLVADLEIFFLQLAHLEARGYRPGLELAQTILDERAVLFQLTLDELQRTPARAALPPAA